MIDYLSRTLDYQLKYKDACKNAEAAGFVYDATAEKESLTKIFKDFGGTEWRNKNCSWLADNTEHCN